MVDQEEFLRKIVQYLNNQQNEALGAELEDLVEQSAFNKRIYDHIVLIWNNSSDLHKLDQIDEDAAVISLEARLAELPPAQVVDAGSGFNIKRWIIAASLLLVAGFGLYIYNQQPKIKFMVKATKGAIDSVKLADGSEIYLDAFTELKYPDVFYGKVREISLIKGQAFFKIHHDASHPFVVSIRRSSVTVLGTSFNINSEENQIALNVSTGRVKFQPFANNSDGPILRAGTGIVYDEGKGIETIVPSVNHNNQYWLTHEIDFVDASLIEVCKQLEECYKVKITLSSNTSAFKKFNAHFKDNKLSDVIEVLRDTYPVNVKQAADGSIIIQSLIK